MPAQKIAVTSPSAERGMTPSGVAIDTGETSCSRSPTFSPIRSAKRLPTATVKPSPKSLSVPQSIGLPSSLRHRLR